MAATVVIPARGGSKGVPRKNLQRVGGVSLIGRAVLAARASKIADRVIVSTDALDIRQEAERSGAEALERPGELATDEASSESVLLHVLEVLHDRGEPEPPVLIFVQCTSPFVEGADIDAVAAPVLAGAADCAFSAVPFHGFVWRPQDAGGVIGVNHDPGSRPRRQDRPVEYLETGAVYALRTAGFASARHRFFGRVQAVTVDPVRSMEIDTSQDLLVAASIAAALGRDTAQRISQAPSLVALDFDGVFTDNRVLIDETGREAVLCHRGDGHGLAALSAHVPIVVFSTERNPVVEKRCEKLGLTCLQGLGDTKAESLRTYAAAEGIKLDDTIFVGNDINDLECLRMVGTPIAVADAVPEVRAAARYVLSRGGGEGALRELCDQLLPLFAQPGKVDLA